jgi:hypothetical protein
VGRPVKGEAAHELGRQVLALGGRAAVSGEEELPPGLQGLDGAVDHPLERALSQGSYPVE